MRKGGCCHDTNITKGMIQVVGARRGVQPRQFNGNQGGSGLASPPL